MDRIFHYEPSSYWGSIGDPLLETPLGHPQISHLRPYFPIAQHWDRCARQRLLGWSLRFLGQSHRWHRWSKSVSDIKTIKRILSQIQTWWPLVAIGGHWWSLVAIGPVENQIQRLWKTHLPDMLECCTSPWPNPCLHLIHLDREATSHGWWSQLLHWAEASWQRKTMCTCDTTQRVEGCVTGTKPLQNEICEKLSHLSHLSPMSIATFLPLTCSWRQLFIGKGPLWSPRSWWGILPQWRYERQTVGGWRVPIAPRYERAKAWGSSMTWHSNSVCWYNDDHRSSRPGIHDNVTTLEFRVQTLVESRLNACDCICINYKSVYIYLYIKTAEYINCVPIVYLLMLVTDPHVCWLM